MNDPYVAVALATAALTLGAAACAALIVGGSLSAAETITRKSRHCPAGGRRS